MEFLVAGILFLLAVVMTVQLAFLLSGKGAVDTAAHFAARKFALSARADSQKARNAAFSKAAELCRHRIGGGYSNLTLTTVDFRSPDGGQPTWPARTGDAYRVDLSHWLELVVPWANRILYEIAPVRKARLGTRYYLVLSSSRLVTIE